MDVKRREFLKATATGAAATLGGASLWPAGRGAAQVLPRPRGRRLVVLGGGFAGIHAARTVMRLVPDAEVVLLERNPFFVSCPATLEYLFGLNSLDTITFGYAPLVARGIRVLRTEATAIEPDRKRVIAAAGAVEYDHLLVATGIRLAPEEIPGLDEAYALNASIYDKGSPIIDARRKIEAFAGGTVVLSAPAVPYKCPPGPYEYALLWAEHVKKRGLRARIVLVDAKPGPQPGPNAPAFLDAMAAHRDILEYRPQTRITGVDGPRRQVRTDAGDLAFDFLSVIPPNRASTLIRAAGLGAVFADVDPVTFRSTRDAAVWAVGDAAQTPFTKSAYTGSVTGKIVGAHIARAMGASVPEPGAPHNVCYPYVAAERAILTRADWSYESQGGRTEVKTRVTVENTPRSDLAQIRREWERGLWREMFGA